MAFLGRRMSIDAPIAMPLTFDESDFETQPCTIGVLHTAHGDAGRGPARRRAPASSAGSARAAQSCLTYGVAFQRHRRISSALAIASIESRTKATRVATFHPQGPLSGKPMTRAP